MGIPITLWACSDNLLNTPQPLPRFNQGGGDFNSPPSKCFGFNSRYFAKIHLSQRANSRAMSSCIHVPDELPPFVTLTKSAKPTFFVLEYVPL